MTRGGDLLTNVDSGGLVEIQLSQPGCKSLKFQFATTHLLEEVDADGTHLRSGVSAD